MANKTAKELMENSVELRNAVQDLDDMTSRAAQPAPSLEEQVLEKLKEIETILTKLDGESIDLSVFLSQIQTFTDEKKAELQLLVDKVDNPLGTKTITTKTFTKEFLGVRNLFYQEVWMKDGNITRYGDIFIQGIEDTTSCGGFSQVGFRRQPLPQDVEFDLIAGADGNYMARPKAGQSNVGGVSGSLDNYLFVWGENNLGCLGVGNTSAVSQAKAIQFNARVEQMEVTAWDHNVNAGQASWVILSNGDFLTCGYGGDYALCTGNNSNLSTFQKVESGVSFATMIPCGTFFVKGTNLYGCGYQSSGQAWLGSGDSVTKQSPTIVKALTDFKGIQPNLTLVSSTWYDNTLLFDEGKLFGVGNNSQKVLDSSGSEFLSFKPVKLASGDEIALKDGDSFFCIAYNIYVLREEGGNFVLYAGGDSGYNGANGSSDFALTKLKTFDGLGWKLVSFNVMQNESNVFCIVYNETKKEIWALGTNYDGSLGVGNDSTLRTLTKVNLPFSIQKAERFELRYEHFNGWNGMQIVADDEIWACGSADSGRLPKEIYTLQKINKEF